MKPTPRMQAVQYGISKFGRLIVVGVSDKKNSQDYQAFYDCVCECGSRKVVRKTHVLDGLVRSCGCLNREVAKTRGTRHGMSHTPIHNTWTTIIMRCRNPNDHKYKDYGGRGIDICDRWFSSFEAFLADVGERPSPDHSIDRIDNNGNYEPGNVRWATRIEQGNNRRTNRLVTYAGETLTVTEWSRRLQISRDTIYRRLRRGLSGEAVLHEVR